MYIKSYTSKCYTTVLIKITKRKYKVYL